MNDPIDKLFDPDAGPLTPEEETALCQALGRIQREGDDDEQSQKLRNLVEITKSIATSSLDTGVPSADGRASKS